MDIFLALASMKNARLEESLVAPLPLPMFAFAFRGEGMNDHEEALNADRRTLLSFHLPMIALTDCSFKRCACTGCVCAFRRW